MDSLLRPHDGCFAHLSSLSNVTARSVARDCPRPGFSREGFHREMRRAIRTDSPEVVQGTMFGCSSYAAMQDSCPNPRRSTSRRSGVALSERRTLLRIILMATVRCPERFGLLEGFFPRDSGARCAGHLNRPEHRRHVSGFGRGESIAEHRVGHEARRRGSGLSLWGGGNGIIGHYMASVTVWMMWTLAGCRISGAGDNNSSAPSPRARVGTSVACGRSVPLESGHGRQDFTHCATCPSLTPP